MYNVVMADIPDIPGGEKAGGPDHLTRSELLLLERDIRKKGPRFYLTDKARKEVPAEMERLATGKRQSPRARIAAARVLVAMDQVNLVQERVEQGIAGPVPTVSVSVHVDVFQRVREYELALEQQAEGAAVCDGV